MDRRPSPADQRCLSPAPRPCSDARRCHMTAITTLPVPRVSEDPAAFAPILVADWRDALFVHFRVDPALLQPSVPLPLDLFDGQAYISLVAFTQHNLRPTIGGRLAAWLSKPLA